MILLKKKFMFCLNFILLFYFNFGECKILPTREELLKNVANVPKAENTLIFASVIFRHGDRTLTTESTYAADPHKYASYFPYGTGELTQDGMLDSYKLGLELRQRYDNFLGKTYYSDLIGALSSPKIRCQASLQCLYTSLFPPNEEEQFLAGLPWRPITYDVLPLESDDTFALYECDNYWDFKSIVTNKTVLNLYEYLTKYTGQEIRNNSALFLIYDAIKVQIKLGKPQPDWVSKIYPEPITSASHQTYNDMIAQRLRLGASGLYRRLNKDIVNKLEGKLSPPRRKMMLYAAHEQTIIYALGGIKAYKSQVPIMVSYLAFELHYINGTFGIKVYFQNYNHVSPESINILGQGEFCPLDVFLEGTRWLTDGPIPFCK